MGVLQIVDGIAGAHLARPLDQAPQRRGGGPDALATDHPGNRQITVLAIEPDLIRTQH
jgi:hypothetical protein